TKFSKFTDNFLRFNTTPGNVDWFDDDAWKVILQKADIVSWLCKEGDLKGVMFDTEPYEGHPFEYGIKLKERTLSEYRAQAQKRGQELAAALTKVKPNIVIMFTYSNSVLLQKPALTAEQKKLGALMPAFIDGMLEGASPSATFVDGMEMAYPLK